LRANVRRGQRYNDIWEDVEFKSIFGTVTFNFMDDKMSLDIGARYQDVEKVMSVISYGATWVFDVEPVSAGVGGPPGCTEDDEPINFDYCLVDPATARITGDVAPGADLWTIHYRDTRNTPDEWLPSMAQPVGLTAPDFNAAGLGGPYIDEPFSAQETNPQITLRYSPNENVSFYAKYAESFKIGGFDTGQTSVPTSRDALVYDSEDAETIELGVKGTAWGGRFGYEATLFELEFPNLQTTTISSDPEQTSESINAGQRVRGLEFNLRFAASENLLLSFGGAFMDGIMTEFPGAGCTDAEITIARADPNAPCKLFDGDTRVVPPPVIDAEDAFDNYDSFIDRSGADAPRTPDWKFILTADYRVPVGSKYEFALTAKGYVSDGYILAVESFSQIVQYNEHEDLNIMLGLGDIDGRWMVSVFARNLFEAQPSYNAEFDTFPNGTASASLGPSNFTTYGVKFDYVMR
jgi:outer membrane receptor protein involved in Fe transport